MEGAEEGPHPASDTKVAATTKEILLGVGPSKSLTTATHHPSSLYLFLKIELIRTYRAYIPRATSEQRVAVLISSPKREMILG